MSLVQLVVVTWTPYLITEIIKLLGFTLVNVKKLHGYQNNLLCPWGSTSLIYVYILALWILTPSLWSLWHTYVLRNKLDGYKNIIISLITNFVYYTRRCIGSSVISVTVVQSSYFMNILSILPSALSSIQLYNAELHNLFIPWNKQNTTLLSVSFPVFSVFQTPQPTANLVLATGSLF